MKTRMIGAVALLALIGCAKDTIRDDTGRPLEFDEPTSVKVQRRDIVGYETLPGELYVPPASEAVVHAPYQAPVERVMATVGQSVRKGEVLLTLSFPDVQANLQAARDAVRQAETAHANARSTYIQPLRQAERQLEQARATERTIRRQTPPDGDATALQDARAQREMSEQAVQVARADYQTNMLQYEQQLEAAREAFRQAQSGAKQAQVKAPISGTVLEINAKPGETVGDGGEELVRIVDLSDIQVRANLTDAEAGLVEDKKPVVIAFNDFAQEFFEGWVVGVRSLPNEGGGVRREANIGFHNEKGLVKPGATVDFVGVEIGRAKDVLAVPVQAVNHDQTGKPVVNVLESGRWIARVVETGLSDGRWIEIKSGLKADETVQVLPEDD